MPVEIRSDDLALEFEALARDEAKQAANRWFSTSQEALFAAGDEHDYEVQDVDRAAMPPQWDSGAGGFVMHWPHIASQWFNAGTAPHEVSGDPVLAFEWEEMKGEEFGDTGKTFDEVYSDTWPVVFLPEVEVSGIEALRYYERGEEAALRYYERQTGADPRQLTRGRYR